MGKGGGRGLVSRNQEKNRFGGRKGGGEVSQNIFVSKMTKKVR